MQSQPVVELSLPKKWWIVYLILLGVTLGASLFAGAVVAPTIFHADALLGGGVLSHFQEGVVMTQIFKKLSWLINGACAAILVVEGYHFLRFWRDAFTFYTAFVTVWSGFLFSLYYLPQIEAWQAEGPETTATELFANTHKMSEWDFKIFVVALTLLMGRYLYRKIV